MIKNPWHLSGKMINSCPKLWNLMRQTKQMLNLPVGPDLKSVFLQKFVNEKGCTLFCFRSRN